MSIGDSTVISQAHQSTKATHYTELGNEKLENDASVSTDAEIGVCPAVPVYRFVYKHSLTFRGSRSTPAN